MRLFSLYFFVSLMATICVGEVVLPSSEVFSVAPTQDLAPMGPNFGEMFSEIMAVYSAKNSKRDVLESNLQSLLSSLQSSGVILNVLHEIAGSTDEMNTLSSYIYKALLSISTNNPIAGLNVTVNLTDILNTVKSSGIITSTLSSLFLNETERNTFTDSLGEVLVNNTWISQLVKDVGESGQISWEMIFNTARNTKSKDPSFNGTTYTSQDGPLSKRDAGDENFNGSLSSFVNNVVGSFLGSNLLDSSFSSILDAVQGSGIIVPTVQEVLADQSLQKMVGFIANKLYNYGVFDQIPINKYFQELKKSGFLSRLLQASFSNDMQSYVIGSIFYRLEEMGVFDQMRRNLYGP